MMFKINYLRIFFFLSLIPWDTPLIWCKKKHLWKYQFNIMSTYFFVVIIFVVIIFRSSNLPIYQVSRIHAIFKSFKLFPSYLFFGLLKKLILILKKMLITCVKSKETTNTVEDLKFTGIFQNEPGNVTAPSGFLVQKYHIKLFVKPTYSASHRSHEFRFLNNLVSTPLQCIIVCAILWINVGGLPVIGIFGLLIMIPVQIVLGKAIYKISKNVLKATDARIKLMYDIICSMKIIKLYAWEESFWKQIFEKRKKQLKPVTKRAQTENKANTNRWCGLGLRLGKFLLIEEYSPSIGHRGIDLIKESILEEEDPPIVSFKRVYSSYGMLNAGDFLCVIGEIGSGKVYNFKIFIIVSNFKLKEFEFFQTSLLKTVLKEMVIKSGSVKVRGKIAYACQQPWAATGCCTVSARRYEEGTSYELSAVPPSLIHKDGSMKKTGKAELTKKLEANFADILVEQPQILTIPEPTSSAYIIDGYDSEGDIETLYIKQSIW
ncbi:Multidrug resistance-associated protein 4 [Nymphon striatum]|nr:Multidrug resistance-associated protein 4 [Nymphon striatum]